MSNSFRSGMTKNVRAFLVDFSNEHTESFKITIGKKEFFVIKRLTLKGETVYSVDLNKWYKDIFELKRAIQ